MSQFITVSVEAGQVWRRLSAWRKFLVWVGSPSLAAAVSREARQAEVLGLPDPAPRITGRATDLGRDWF